MKSFKILIGRNIILSFPDNEILYSLNIKKRVKFWAVSIYFYTLPIKGNVLFDSLPLFRELPFNLIDFPNLIKLMVDSSLQLLSLSEASMVHRL